MHDAGTMHVAVAIDTECQLGDSLLAALLSACGDKGGAPAGGGGGMPPAEVGVVTVEPHAVGLVTELPGRLEASRVAQVRARAAGILQKRLSGDCEIARRTSQKSPIGNERRILAVGTGRRSKHT